MRNNIWWALFFLFISLLGIKYYYSGLFVGNLSVTKNLIKGYSTVSFDERRLKIELVLRGRDIDRVKLQNGVDFMLKDEGLRALTKRIKLSFSGDIKEFVLNEINCDTRGVLGDTLGEVKKNKIAFDLNKIVPIKSRDWGYPRTEMCFSAIANSSFDFSKIQKIKYLVKNLSRGGENVLIENTFVDLRKFKYFNKISQSKADFLQENKIFKSLEGNQVLLVGNHKIEETIIIPKGVGLVIAPGTTLLMKEGISFVSYGKVLAEGTKGQKIIVKAQDPQKPFGVFALANEGAAGSSFKNFHMEHGSEAHINGIYFSGMFSAYHNEVAIEDSYFGYSHSDDGINLKYSDSKILNSVFEKNMADGIDFDFMAGEIRGSQFIENGNDAIDTSGSTTLIQDNYIYKSGDKCMSFGEKSKTRVVNNLLEECFIGVECKDSTTSVFIANKFLRNKTAINSYQKKDFYGPAHCVFYNSVFEANERGSVFENNFNEGEKKKTDASKVTIENMENFDTFDISKIPQTK